MGVKSKGAAAAMRDIEITNDESGVPTVQLHGDAKTKAEDRGISKVVISLSHSDVSSSLPRPTYFMLMIYFQNVAIAFAQACQDSPSSVVP